MVYLRPVAGGFVEAVDTDIVVVVVDTFVAEQAPVPASGKW